MLVVQRLYIFFNPQGYILFYSTSSNRLGLGFGLGLVLELGGNFPRTQFAR